MTGKPKVILVDGDPYLVVNEMLTIKREWFPKPPLASQWVEFDLPPKAQQDQFIASGLNAVDGQASTASFGGEEKVVVLRGLMNDDKFRRACFQMIQRVAPGNCLLILDDDGAMAASRGKGEGSWEDFKLKCKAAGEFRSLSPPLSSLDSPWKQRDKAIVVVTAEFRKRGKIPTKGAVETLCSMGPLDRAYLIPEVEKICFAVTEQMVDEQAVRNTAIPAGQDFEIYLFYSAFNTGGYVETMRAAEKLADTGMPYDAIMGFCAKQTRLHLIAADVMSYGADPRKILKRIGDSSRAWKAAEFLWSDRAALRDFLRGEQKPDPTEAMKKVGKISPKNMEEALHVAGLILKEASAAAPEERMRQVLAMAMERHQAVINAIVDIRLAPPENKAVIFDSVIKNICWR